MRMEMDFFFVGSQNDRFFGKINCDEFHGQHLIKLYCLLLSFEILLMENFQGYFRGSDVAVNYRIFQYIC